MSALNGVCTPGFIICGQTRPFVFIYAHANTNNHHICMVYSVATNGRQFVLTFLKVVIN